MGNAQLKDIGEEGEDFVDELKPGTKLMHGQYEIERFLNAGGFGITYLAKDSLERKIVIKECFPGAFCRRSKTIVQARSRAHQPELKSIVRLFVQEARSLAKLDHPNIVGVHQVFEDNDTAYMALDFVEGRDLLDTLEDPNHGLNPAQIKSILTDILGAVGFIHDQEMLHRDISPDNILIDENMRPVLIDFGAAREQATKQSRVLSALRVVKDGYSPQEFYIAGSEQTASSDLYALGASFYHLIANEVPPNSQGRLAAIASGESDPYVPLAGRIKGYDRDFLAAIDKSLQVLPKDRVQSAKDWLDMMNGKVIPISKTVAAASAVPATSDQEKSKMPMLMASVAVVALLGVVIVTQTDVLSGTDPVADATQAPVTEPAAAVFEPTNPVEAAPSEIVDAAPVGADSVDIAVDQTPVGDVLAGVDPAEPSTIVDPAPETVAETIAPLDEAPLVESVTTSDNGLVTRSPHPELRPESLGVVAEVVEQLPTPAITPDIIRDAAQRASLPGFLANVPVPPDAGTPVLALPEIPADVLADEVAIAFNEPAFVPGNEIIAEPAPVVAAQEPAPVVVETEDIAEQNAEPVLTQTEAAPNFVLSGWSVELPFSASETQPNAIGAAAFVAPTWVEEGVVVKSVNGFPIEGIGDINKTLRDNVNIGDTNQVTVSFEIETDGVAATHDWPVPIKQEIQLLNGTSFAARYVDDVWVTTVTAIPAGVETEMQVGDKLIAYIPNSTKIETRTALKDVIDAAVAAGTTQLSFAVNRDNAMWVAGLAYDANPAID